MSAVYRISGLGDMYAVPSDRREEFFDQLRLVMEFNELALGEDAALNAGPLVWTDDGDSSVQITDTDGKQVLALKVFKGKRKAPAVPSASVRLAIPWGSFGLNGEWEPNLGLKMSADEQRRRNIANGYLPAPPASDSPTERSTK